MTSKARQLLLELYLLRLRYADSEIEQISNISEIMSDPELNNLLMALKQLQASSSPAKQRGKTLKESSRSSVRGLGYDRGGVQKAIGYFVDRLVKKRILPTQDQLDSFARSIGVSEIFNDRQELARSIRKNLESMPPTLAIQMMRSVDGKPNSDSDPYVNLAKTLMRT
jgi:hypothetical protein